MSKKPILGQVLQEIRELTRKTPASRVSSWDQVVNLTPHSIKVHTSEGVQEIPPSGFVARLLERGKLWGKLLGVPIVKVKMSVPSLPSSILSQGLVFIVSDVARKPFQRKYKNVLFVSPDTGPSSAIRDKAGRIIGVKRFRL